MYNIIYADPAWPYAKRKPGSGTKFGGGVHGHYDIMTEEEIAGMGVWVKSICDKNCALLMWTTGPRQDMAIRVMNTWGFRYSTVAFTWLKAAKSLKLPCPIKVRLPDRKVLELPAGTMIPFSMLDERIVAGLKTIVGPGNYTGSNIETVLLGVKGSMKVSRKLVPQVVIHPRMKHSRKPEEVRRRIVEAFGDLPRIEIFARDKALGWEATGLELDGTDYTKLKAIQAVQLPGAQLILPAA